jgi:hypothetical protein
MIHVGHLHLLFNITRDQSIWLIRPHQVSCGRFLRTLLKQMNTYFYIASLVVTYSSQIVRGDFFIIYTERKDTQKEDGAL